MARVRDLKSCAYILSLEKQILPVRYRMYQREPVLLYAMGVTRRTLFDQNPLFVYSIEHVDISGFVAVSIQ